MNILNKGSSSLLLISCVLSASMSFPALAGDGTIVVGRNVQPYAIGRAAFGPDPYPNTVNANPSKQILGATGELSDLDISGVSSGSSIAHTIMPNGNLPGLTTHQQGTSGSMLGAGASAGGSGSGLGGQINGSIQRGMAPLNNIGSMLGGQ